MNISIFLKEIYCRYRCANQSDILVCFSIYYRMGYVNTVDSEALKAIGKYWQATFLCFPYPVS